jgi:hypothetical protein
MRVIQKFFITYGTNDANVQNFQNELTKTYSIILK